MAVEIKFCGLTRAADAAFAVGLGASYLGVIFAGGPRRITPERAAELFAAARGAALRVGVFGAEAPEEVARMARTATLDVVQLHGDPDAAHVASVRAACGLPVWAAVRVSSSATPERLGALDAAADAIVLDAFVPGRLGGTGIAFDWEGAARWARPLHAHLVVAGGLRPENVGQAVRRLVPDVVDVSSGVEAAPGIKDHERMRAFVEAARREDNRR